MAESAQAHLLNHLRDAHALEVQAFRQLTRAAQRPTEGEEREVYTALLERAQEHERAVRELVEGHDHSASPVEDKTLRAGVIGVRQLSDVPPNTPVKEGMHLYALAHLKIATYELLAEIAQRAEDDRAAGVAQDIRDQEREAAEKISGTFDRAAQLVLDEPATKESSDQDQERDPQADLLLAHLEDVHALEQQSLQLLGLAVDGCQDEELTRVYRDHLEQTEKHEQSVNERIEARDAKPSAIKDLHLSTAKSGLHDLAKGPPDTAVKLAMNCFCLEHLEIAAYEFLIRIADEAGDSETAEAARQILEEERSAAESVRGAFKRSVELMLESEASYDDISSAEISQEARS